VSSRTYANFSSEFLNRFDETVLFKPLTMEELFTIVDLPLVDLNARRADRRVTPLRISGFPWQPSAATGKISAANRGALTGLCNAQPTSSTYQNKISMDGLKGVVVGFRLRFYSAKLVAAGAGSARLG